MCERDPFWNHSALGVEGAGGGGKNSGERSPVSTPQSDAYWLLALHPPRAQVQVRNGGALWEDGTV